MTKTVEFIYDTGSPNAYYAHRAIPQVQARHNVVFEYTPVLLGGVMKLTNNVSPMVSLKGIRNKGAYVQLETRRWLDRYPVPEFKFNPDFPVNGLMMMRGATFARDKDYYANYINAMFSCMWEQPRKLDEPEVYASALKEHGLPAEEILEGIQMQRVKDALISETERAVERGVFGAPTFFLDGEIYFGKETLRDIEDILG